MLDVMLDIETLSTNSNAVILSIGAVKFKRDDPVIPLEKMDTFYVKINADSCVDKGLTISTETINWWNDQIPKIREEAFSGTVPLEKALKQFSIWFRKSTYVWGNGDDFDCVIVDNAYKACQLPTPWKFYNTRDCRTIYDIGRVNLKNFTGDQQHHALYDCYYQINALKQAVKNITP